MERPYKRLIEHPDFEIPVPSSETLVGFLAICAVAAAMVAGLLVFAWWMRG